MAALRAADAGREGRLAPPRARGGTLTVPLDAEGIGGRTRAIFVSPAGEYIGGGQTFAFEIPGASFFAAGTRSGVTVEMLDAGGRDVRATFKPPANDTLFPGTYEAALRAPFSGLAAGLEVSGSGRGCNTIAGEFTVTEATYALDGRIRTFGAEFTQRCEGVEPALRGLVEYRVTGLPPAGWPAPAPPAGTGAPAAAPAPAPAPAPARPGATLPDTRAPERVPSCGAPALARLRTTRGTRRGGRMRVRSGRGRLLGGPDRDRLDGAGGGGCLDGGPGDDVLHGGRGDDLLVGGRGTDILGCGPGKDVAVAGPRDRVSRCERVVRVRP